MGAQLANVCNKHLVQILEALRIGSEITIAMMKTTMLHANLMVEIAVIILPKTGTGIAQNVHAFLANLDNVYGKKTSPIMKMITLYLFCLFIGDNKEPLRIKKKKK